MTKLLLRLFVKNTEDYTNASTRAQVGKLSGLTGIICNLFLFAFKLAAGILSGAVSITADAMNNLSDASSSVVTLVGFKLAGKPADEDHPYGHARYEYLSGLAVAGLIVVIGFELAKTSAEKVFAPTPIAFSWPIAIVLIVSILVKLWLAIFNHTLGEKIRSAPLLATAADSRNDVVMTLAVLGSGIVEMLTGYPVDGYVGFCVALFILYSGAMLAKQTISPLLGENASPELRKLIIDTIRQEPRVLGYHDLMVHDYGPGQRFASLHVEMDQKEDPLLCHELIDDLERACYQAHNVHLVIHYDPVAVGDEKRDALCACVEQALREYDARLTLHDFRMVPGTGHTNLVFDVTLPDDLDGQKKQIRQGIENALIALNQGKFYTVITFDPAFFNAQDF